MISAIVPVYNGAHVLRKTVPDMLAQSVPTEWLFVDDGSTDATRAVLDELIATCGTPPGSSARVLALPTNRGRAVARNAGIAEARHPVLVFLDADVAPRPGALAALAGALTSPQVVAAVGRLTFEEADPADPYQRYLGSARRGAARVPPAWPVPWRYFLLTVAAVRASALHEVGPLDEAVSYGEDLELGYRLREHYPEGLRRVEEAAGRLFDLGTIDSALLKMEEFARDNLPGMVARHPDLASAVGLDRVGAGAGFSGRLSALALRPWPARAVRRLLPVLPPGLSNLAIRYLLGYTLASSYRGMRA